MVGSPLAEALYRHVLAIPQLPVREVRPPQPLATPATPHCVSSTLHRTPRPSFPIASCCRPNLSAYAYAYGHPTLALVPRCLSPQLLMAERKLQLLQQASSAAIAYGGNVTAR